MKYDLVSVDNLKIDDIEINDFIFNAEYRPDLLKVVVEWQLSKRRSGCHVTKNVSKVAGTTAKPHRQKGTGKARQGSLRSVQFRGGGVAFGPVFRSHAYEINSKVRKFALRSALSHKLREKQLLFLDKIPLESHKTKNFLSIINKIFDKSLLIVSSDADRNLKLSSGNLKFVNLISSQGVNVYDILLHKYIAILHPALINLEKRLS